jgi:hypothetical protein
LGQRPCTCMAPTAKGGVCAGILIMSKEDDFLRKPRQDKNR